MLLTFASVAVASPGDVILFDFRTDNGWEYDGRIEVPEAPSGWAVMLIGGGLGSTIDWFIDGIMTIDGKPTRDADTISDALLRRGFTLIRWQAIRRGDSKHAQDPLMMDVGSFEQTVEQAHKAWAAFRTHRKIPPRRIFLVGHSLGAFRASMLVAENSEIAGVVLLAGAKLIPSDLDEVRRIVGLAGADGDPTLRHNAAIAALDKRLSRWEQKVAGEKTKYGLPWPADVLTVNKTPTLLLVGALDERWLLESYAFTSYMRRCQHADYTWRVFEELGHQLAKELPGEVRHEKHGIICNSRTGPIEESVVQTIVEWIERRAR